jgi:hypothetical protein
VQVSFFREKNVMSHSSAGRVFAGLVLLGGLAGCGGPLSYMVKTQDVSAEARTRLQADEQAVAEAVRRRDEAKQKSILSVEHVKTTEADLKTKDGDLDIAKKRLALEEARDNAGRTADTDNAESRLSAAKQAAARAKKALALAEAEAERDSVAADEAKQAWLTTLADFELKKARELLAAGNATPVSVTEFEQQREKQAKALTDVRAKLADRESEVAEAREELVDVD